MFNKKHVEKWRLLSWANRGLLLETAVFSICVKLMLQLLPFRFIAPYLGQQTHLTTQQSIPPHQQKQAERIAWAVRVLDYRTKWRNSCLVNAIIAKIMLRRRQVSTQLFLGLAKDKQHNLQAHAWLSCGDFIVAGQETHERFVVMGTFIE